MIISRNVGPRQVWSREYHHITSDLKNAELVVVFVLLSVSGGMRHLRTRRRSSRNFWKTVDFLIIWISFWKISR